MTGFKLKQIHFARKHNLLQDTTFERKRDEEKKKTGSKQHEDDIQQ